MPIELIFPYPGQLNWDDENNANLQKLADAIDALPSGGGGGSSGIEYPFPSPVSTWVITHNIGRKPGVDIYLSNGELTLADIIVSSTTVTITFASPTSGYAVLT